MTIVREIRAHGEASPAITVGLDSLSCDLAGAGVRSAQDAASASQGRRLVLRRGVLDDRVDRGQNAGYRATVRPTWPRSARSGADPDPERGDHVLGPRRRREGN